MTADFTYNSESPENEFRDRIAPGIELLTIIILDPSRNLVALYDDVIYGDPSYAYLSFHFDPASLTLAEGKQFDIGADPGYWLGGSTSYGYALFRDNYSGEAGDEPFILVGNGGSPVITIIPEPSCSLLAFLGVIPWLMRRPVHRGSL